MRTMLKLFAIGLLVILAACAPKPTSNDIQRQNQEKVVSEGVSEVGIPAIKNFREFKLLKTIYELRDQDGLATYSYVENIIPTVVKGQTAMGGKLTFFCDSIGYPIPYATQFSAPETMQPYNTQDAAGVNKYYGVERLPQSEPNALFSPAAADGTWVVCTDPYDSKKTGVVYSEPKLASFPYELKLD